MKDENDFILIWISLITSEENIKKKFFWCRPFLKSLLNLLQYCLCFMFLFFGHDACGILAPWPGLKPAPPTLEGKVLTTGPPGKSQEYYFIYLLWSFAFFWELSVHILYTFFHGYSSFSFWFERALYRLRILIICSKYFPSFYFSQLKPLRTQVEVI